MNTGRSAALERLVERCAAPNDVAAALDRLRGTPQLAAVASGAADAAEGLVAVMAASRSLRRVLVTRPDHLEVFTRLERREAKDERTIDDLLAWRQHEFLRITARDLLGHDDLEVVTARLSSLAADVLDSAYLLAEADGLAVIGMGKLGGNELNYASDVDIVFCGEGDPAVLAKQARSLLDLAGRAFRIDTNLRPQGRDGPLVRSVDSYEAYWDRWAEPWEFQALLKATVAAGDRRLGASFIETAQRWLWHRPFDSDDLRRLRHLKARSEEEVQRRGLADREVKRGRGGIRDIEFTVQLLQLVHGRVDPDLRSPTTLVALQEMADAGYVDPSDAAQLTDAYRYLRTVEHRLQLVDERQTHVVPEDPTALDHLARVMGERDGRDGTAAENFLRELRQHQLAVRLIHERIYFRPLLEAFSRAEGSLDEDAAAYRLTAFGFTDAARTRAAVRELTTGLNRTSRLMQQMLPLLLDWLSSAPDPDLGLLLLRNLLTGPERTTQLLEAFRESPDAARRLCTILGTSRLVGDILVHNPDLVSRLPDEARLRTRDRDHLVQSARTAVAWRDDPTEQQEALRRWNDRNLLGIAARDILGAADVNEVAGDLTRLAEATLETALSSLDARIPFAVVALGRFGGGELSYASDLDVIFVYDGATAADATEAMRVASGLLRVIGGATPAGRLYEIDAALRPEGKQGALARTIAGYEHYWQSYALVWERQAMIRARPVAGDPDLADELLATVAPYVWGGGLTPDDTREIRRMKARIERERIPFGEDPEYHLKLGRGSLSDVEFTVQLLQLQRGIANPSTMGALDDLELIGALAAGDASVLREAYRFCERTRNRWYLVSSRPGNALPTEPRQFAWLARSLDMTPGQLRETYKRVTRRARNVVERVFYGGA